MLPGSLLTYCLLCVFGVGSWVAVNGLWAEISILTRTLPECNCLPAVLVVVIQLANIGPLLYTLTNLYVQKRGYSVYRLEVAVVFVLVVVGLLSCVALAVFWDRVTLIGGSEHSVSLIVISLFLASVDCTSSVVFLPFLKHFPSQYVSALYIGEGLSGVLPSLTALSQGFANSSSCDTDPSELGLNFSPTVFFALLASVMVLCGIAFLLLNTLPQVRVIMTTNLQPSINTTTIPEEQVTLVDTQLPTSRGLLMTCVSILRAHVTVYFCLGLINFLTNGALSAISAFALFPYGSEVYHVAINLALLATPVLSAAYLLVPHKSPVFTSVLTSLATLLGVYILMAALMDPPPLHNLLVGKMLIVSASIYSVCPCVSCPCVSPPSIYSVSVCITPLYI